MIRLKDILSESNLTEAKFYVSYNPGRGMGKKVVNSPESDYEEPRVFRNYNDAEKYVKKTKGSGASPGRIISYWVSDINSNRIDRLGNIAEDINEAMIKAIDITFTDRGRFYKVEVDGQRRVKGYDDLRSSEESLSNLLGYDISLRSMDDRVLDKAIKDLEQKGIELTYNDAMDVS